MSDPITRLNAALEGRYTIERELGEGGMATVYLADDLKHERKVALKVLKPELAAVVGADRFLAEIKTTANLQHPHILPLFDSGEADGFVFYVMPFVEGESLRDRLDREKQLPVEEAIEIGVKVAGALEAAHRSGVIHRDIKPANILLQNGEPLVADYGIALAVSQAGGTRLTETGLSLGTPHYMSPEQATGDRELDARSDVYALGAVVYEMLVGDPPHIGSTAQAVVAKILTEVPSPVSGPRPLVSGHVEAAVAKALAKMPADRFRSAEQFAAALDGRSPIGPPAGEGTWGARTAPSTLVRLATEHRWLGWAIPLSMFALAGLALFAQLAPEGAPSLPTRFVIPVPDGIEVGFFDLQHFAVSPDGRDVVYATEGQLFLKSWDEFEGTPIPGTEGGVSPFFSADGEWIGFSYETEELRKVQVDGGPVLAITSGNGVFGASWGPDDQIVFADALGIEGLWRVSADGGDPEQITTVLDSALETAHVSPQILPDGALLFTVLGPSGGSSDSRIAIQEPGSSTHRIVQPEGTAGVYVPTGHLLYALSDGIIMAAPFDLGEGRVTGSARSVLSGVPISAGGGRPLLAISPAGMVTYAVGSSETSDLLVWVDRDGEELDRIRSPIHGAFVRIAPDGERIALTSRAPGNSNVVLFDSISGMPAGFTFEPREDESPIWSPDGSQVAYSSYGTGKVRYIFVAPVDRSAEPDTLFTGQYHLHLTDWSADGEWIAYYDTNPGRLSDLWVMAADGSPEPRAIATTVADESDGAFSPGVEWLAYAVADGGSSEVWVRSFPDLGGLRQVSNGGGTQPRWSRDGTELFYKNGSTLMSIPVSEEDGSTLFREARPLFDYPTMFEYDVHPDGDRFLLRIENPDAKIRELRVVTDWFVELEALVGN